MQGAALCRWAGSAGLVVFLHPGRADDGGDVGQVVGEGVGLAPDHADGAGGREAHIRPVEHRGPDSVRNGVALSGTVHWLFDRDLISIGPPPGYQVLVSCKGLPDAVQRLVNPNRRLKVPALPLLRPAEVFLDFHRREIFDRPALARNRSPRPVRSWSPAVVTA